MVGHCATFVLVNGGNKSIAAKRYVHGIIQIQVREQVLPIVGGLAKPEYCPFAQLGRNKNHFQPFPNRYSCKTYRPSRNPFTRNVHGIIICCITSHAERGVAFLFSALPLPVYPPKPFRAKEGFTTLTSLTPLTSLTYVNCNWRTQTRDHTQHTSNEKPWRKNRHAHSLRLFDGPHSRRGGH